MMIYFLRWKPSFGESKGYEREPVCSGLGSLRTILQQAPRHSGRNQFSLAAPSLSQIRPPVWPASGPWSAGAGFSIASRSLVSGDQ
jgi:hypothetical protein